QTAKRIYPFVSVLSRFSHPNRNIVFITKGEIFPDRCLVHRHPVLVKSIRELRVERWAKDFEVGVPLGTAQKDYVVSIHLTNGGNNPAIERLEFWVQRIGVEVVCDRLVQQIVSNHCRFRSVTRRNLSPQINGQLLTLAAFEQEWVSKTIVDVVSRLA